MKRSALERLEVPLAFGHGGHNPPGHHVTSMHILTSNSNGWQFSDSGLQNSLHQEDRVRVKMIWIKWHRKSPPCGLAHMEGSCAKLLASVRGYCGGHVDREGLRVSPASNFKRFAL